MRALASLLALTAACTVPDKFFQDGGGGGDDIPDADFSGPDAEPDITAPETTITSMPGDFDNDATPSFEFASDEAGTFVCSFDGETATACTSPATRSLADGPHTFSVTAIDLASNQDESPASHAWTVDTVVPDTTIDSGPPSADNSTTVTFTFSADEANASFECQLDTGAYLPCSSPSMPSGLANGAHTFRVRAIDRAGNVDASPDTHPWTIDTSTPDTTIDSGPSGPTMSLSATFNFSSNAGGGATYECRVLPAAFAACASPRTYPGLTEGATYTFEVRVRNAALTYDPTPATRTWTPDTTAPNTSFTGGVPSTFTNNNSVNISFTSTEPTGATYQCNFDGAGFSSCTSPFAQASLSQTLHSLAVRATDAAGNPDPTPVSASWTVDTTDPTTSTTGPASSSTSTTATFDFSSNESGVTYQCRIDTAAYAGCADPFVATVGQSGHTLDVFATDQAGNADDTPAQHSWTVDSFDPIVTFALPTPVAGSTVGPYNSYVWSVNRTATTTCSINGGAAFPCTSPYITHIKAGAASFAVTATDTFGNDATYTRSFTIACSAAVADGSGGNVFGLLHMDENTGQSLANAGNGVGGGILGTNSTIEALDPTWIASQRFGAGLNFVQLANDTVIWNMGAAAPYPTHDHTIELWIRPTNLTGSSYQDIFNTSGNIVRIVLEPSGVDYLTTYYISTGGTPPTIYTVQMTTPITPNVWHHIVATYGGTTQTLYQDGEMKSGTTGTIAGNFTFSGIRLGNAAKPYPGDMDEVWLSRVALTEAQVMPRYCPPP